MTEIDNKKMWESLIRYGGKYQYFEDAIIDALKDQGLKYENSEIVSIEPELKEKDGNWYRCTQCVENFCEGRLYKSQVDNQGFEWIIDDLEHSYLYGFYTNYFRPATEEEILKAKYGITGIGSKKAEGKLGEMISQRMESAKAKEALLPDGEFTDFQKVLAELISIAQQSCLTPLQLAALHSEMLMLEARKQIVSEIDVIALQKAGLVYQEGEQSAFFAGIDLVLKMIKGE